MAWPFLDPLAREEMVADQFLTGLDNHELRVQIATSDVRRIEYLIRIARSLEAVESKEMGRGRARRSPAQARYAEESECYESEAKCIADQILAKIGPELRPTPYAWATAGMQCRTDGNTTSAQRCLDRG